MKYRLVLVSQGRPLLGAPLDGDAPFPSIEISQRLQTGPERFFEVRQVLHQFVPGLIVTIVEAMPVPSAFEAREDDPVPWPWGA